MYRTAAVESLLTPLSWRAECCDEDFATARSKKNMCRIHHEQTTAQKIINFLSSAFFLPFIESFFISHVSPGALAWLHSIGAIRRLRQETNGQRNMNDKCTSLADIKIPKKSSEETFRQNFSSFIFLRLPQNASPCHSRAMVEKVFMGRIS